MVGEVAEVMRTGVWVGDCFIYTNSMNRLNYFVGGEIVTVSHLDKVCYILGGCSTIHEKDGELMEKGEGGRV